ncbi:hypothetical protein [Sedimenticola hydrogenitrophicus]|uniref:hypothetical protein n=1 Tax=Sedimenticola hydrogenitrophicus TaxID=2967975 RepID=UPI0023B14C33|nr:hypothetical protein [Sedimenticola hydrogenitrophicus]
MISLFDSLLHWRPDAEEFTTPLQLKKPFKLLFDRLPTGIDNSRIDVALSQEFMDRCRLLVRRSMMHDVTENYWGEPPPPPDNKDLQALREGYAGLMELTVDRARKHNRLEMVQLLQFSVVKFLLGLVGQEYDRLRSQVQRAKGLDSHQSSGRSVQLHDRLVVLARNEPAIRYRITRRLFRELLKMENMRLGKLRKSVLGLSWPIPKPLLFNPMLQLPSLWADEQLMGHYPLVCTDRDDPDAFDRVNRLVTGLFADFLPSWCWGTEPLDSFDTTCSDIQTSARRSQGEQDGLVGYSETLMLLKRSLQSAEYESGNCSWLDIPENIDRIVYSARHSGVIRTDHDVPLPQTTWPNDKWPGFHHRLMKRILKAFRGSRIERDLLACHAAPAVYQELNRQVPVRLICQYLAGRMTKRELQRKLNNLQNKAVPAQVVKVLERMLLIIKSMPGPRRRRRVFSFLRHFALFRRDLKQAYQAHVAMRRIHLLVRPEDIELSRRNGSLLEFPLRKELKPEQHRIRNHVILKADVRGSTAITSELRNRNLNPASHFSLNFFEPINKLLDSFGAKKVFIEGDAVILSIFEYEDTPYQWLCVSHACGLAHKILQVVDKQNVKNRQNDLPELELGLGIAFSEEAPAFLYDEGHEIMISPAINRADQLSSCSAAVRRSAYGGRLGCGVRVMAPAASETVNKESSDKLIRYNVNGIELDEPAYYKLKSELSFHRIELEAGRRALNDHLLVARYPDLEGNMHALVIREAVVTVWDGEQAGLEAVDGGIYYEVISDAELIAYAIEHTSRRRRPLPDTPATAEEDPPRPGLFH